VIDFRDGIFEIRIGALNNPFLDCQRSWKTKLRVPSGCGIANFDINMHPNPNSAKFCSSHCHEHGSATAPKSLSRDFPKPKTLSHGSHATDRSGVEIPSRRIKAVSFMTMCWPGFRFEPSVGTRFYVVTCRGI